MVQTELLKLNPPYQIICAGDQMGIQIATLIVTMLVDVDNYEIETHSHPVVSYADKTLAFKQKDNLLKPWEIASNHMRPEGAVWNDVEISDIHVVGITGKTSSINSEDFGDLLFDLPCHSKYYEKGDGRKVIDFFANVTCLLYNMANCGIQLQRPLKLWLDLDYINCQGDEDEGEFNVNVFLSNGLLFSVVSKDVNDVEDVVLRANHTFSLGLDQAEISGMILKLKDEIYFKMKNQKSW